MVYAHSKNPQGERHDLVAHLKKVAYRAREFAMPWAGGEAAYTAGLWHDLGKFDPNWQQYLTRSESDPTVRRRGPPHSHVGALHADQTDLHPLAFVIAGHHSGLPDGASLSDRLAKAKSQTFREGRTAPQALALAKESMGDLNATDAASLFPVDLESETDVEMFLRMTFSALVDADSLDAEEHFTPEAAALRGSNYSPADLLTRLAADQVSRFGPPTTPVQEMREQVYRRCLHAAEGPPGIYRLTVPTGGGKTRSSLAFALKHASLHGKRRVIVAIPYTSIIEQTADVFRKALGDDEIVLEHHNAAPWGVGSEEESDEAAFEDPGYRWQRLSAENWDAQIVVTTFVQLFESLLSNRRSDCRKLHNIADSVLILDEAQTLPVRLLKPLLDVLGQLAVRYGVTVLLCSATLPALGKEELGADALPAAAEIMPDAHAVFADPRLRRVSYQLPTGDPWDWARLAREARAHAQCMIVLNTRRDALALVAALQPDDGSQRDEALCHLSTLLCPAHRREVLAQVRRRLEAGHACRLVTTQVVEAGVDLDFPVVFRAIGPLDRIVQAAGRCNREGRLTSPGRVVVFEPSDGHLPERSGPYRSGTEIGRRLLADFGPDGLFELDLYERYFRELFQSQELDAEGIQDLRRRLEYPEVARRARLIEEDEGSVVVRYPDGNERVNSLIERVRRDDENPRLLLRALQPFMIGVRRSELPSLEAGGFIKMLRPGIWEWLGHYDSLLGIGHNINFFIV